MNYLRQLNAWHKRRKMVGVTLPAQTMYTVILDIVNRAAKGKEWKKWTSISLAQLMAELPATKPTVIKLKRELEEKGFVIIRKVKSSDKGNDCDLWYIVPLYDVKQESETEKVTREAQEARDREQARQIMSHYPGGEVVQQNLIAIGFSALEAAKYIDEGGVRLCREIEREAEGANESKVGLFKAIYARRMGEMSKARQAAAENKQARQDAQEQANEDYTPPTVNKLMCNIS